LSGRSGCPPEPRLSGAISPTPFPEAAPPTSLVRDFIDRNDYTKGFTHNFNPDAPFTILSHACIEAK